MTDPQKMLWLQRAAAVSLTLTLVTNLLPPLPFAMTQLLVDYSHGLLRRGVVGSLFSAVYGPTASVAEVYVIAFGITLAAAIVLFSFLYAGFRDTVAGLMLLVLFACSFAFSGFIGNTGYLDAILLVLALVAIRAWSAGWPGRVAALAAVALGIFVHESMLPYFTVLVGFAIWLETDREARAGPIMAALSPVLVGVASVVFLSFWGHMSPDAAAALAASIAGRAEFWADPAATEIAGRGLTENFAHMEQVRSTTSYWFWLGLDGVPLLAMSGFLAWLNLRMLRGQSALTRLAMAAAVAAPLSLNGVAFDVARFGAISVLAGFICAALILRHVSGAGARLSEALQWPVFVLVLVLNLQIATMHLNQGLGHTTRFPYVLKKQVEWFVPAPRAPSPPRRPLPDVGQSG